MKRRTFLSKAAGTVAASTLFPSFSRNEDDFLDVRPILKSIKDLLDSTEDRTSRVILIKKYINNLIKDSTAFVGEGVDTKKNTNNARGYFFLLDLKKNHLDSL